MISMQNTNYPAYVFATINHGMTKNVVEELKNNPNIDLSAPVTGRFDLALRLKQNNPEQLAQIHNQTRQIQAIQTTQTILDINDVIGATLKNPPTPSTRRLQASVTHVLSHGRLAH